MKIMVIGTGMMGSAIIRDLAATSKACEITAADADVSTARKASEEASCSRRPVRPVQLDLTNAGRAVDLMREHDLVIGAYPERWAVRVTEYALDAGSDLVDITALWNWEQRAKMDPQLREAGVTVIPGCGLAPGLSNILMGIAAERVKSPHTGVIMAGGLPQKPRPPLDYALVFSFETVIDEYTVRPRIIRSGKIQEVAPLSGLETATFDQPVGEAECFYTDGLTTLLDTMPRRGLQEVVEKTVRYRGHRDKILFLAECGFFSDTPIRGEEFTPRQFTSAVLTPLLQTGDFEDVSCLRVIVRGDSAVQFDLMDYYDGDTGITSMARTTGYTCSIIAQMLVDGHIRQKGFLPPEEAITDRNYGVFEEQLKRRSINVIERRTGG